MLARTTARPHRNIFCVGKNYREHAREFTQSGFDSSARSAGEAIPDVPIPTLIETISAGITLYPGDVIATGTPKGVGLGFDPPRYLQPGDSVR